MLFRSERRSGSLAPRDAIRVAGKDRAQQEHILTEAIGAKAPQAGGTKGGQNAKPVSAA